MWPRRSAGARDGDEGLDDHRDRQDAAERERDRAVRLHGPDVEHAVRHARDEGELPATPQDEQFATHAPRLD